MAGGFGTTFANDLQKLIFQATAIANIADNAASSPATNLYCSLHTASPSGGSQTTSEAAYPSYARVAVARTSGGFGVSGAIASLVALTSFPASTGSPSETHTHFCYGTASSGTGKQLFWGTITPNITMNAAGITPQLTTSTTVTLNT